jgi:AcrR family transcriptional regulator
LVDRSIMATKRRDAAATRERIVSAARVVLNRDGVAELSTRSVAAEAAVHLSLIHYHFDSREGLLLAVLERMNQELLDRQRVMYGSQDLSLAEKWRQAIAFYRQDLASGYVRSLMELAGQGFASPRLGSAVKELMRGWRDLLTEVAAEALPRLGITDIAPDEVASAIVSYWYGMELQHSLDMTEKESNLWQTAETLGRLVERLEMGGRQIRPAKSGQEET